MSIINFCETDRKLRERVDDLGLSESRIRTTNIVFNEIYAEFNLTPSELLQKAREDEEQYIINGRIKQKPLDDRIVSALQLDYKYYLENKIYRGRKLLPNTILLKITIYRSFLNYYHIELPNKPKIMIPKSRPTDDDIPSWEDVNDALPNCKSPRDKAIVAFAVTTGLRVSDIVSRKISDFIEACNIYFDEDEEHTLENLLKKDPSKIIPCWDLIPKKKENNDDRNDDESSYTITFNTPECTEVIFKYLNYRIDLDKKNGGDGIINPNEALFRSQRKSNKEGHLPVSAIEYQFRALNIKLGGKMQKNNVYVKFSPHSLRKLFKTTCRRNLKHVDGNSDKMFIGDIVSLFTGHISKENSMKDFYEAIPKDEGESYLRKAYMTLIDSLSIRPIEVKDISTKEYEELQEKNKELRDDYKDLQISMQNQKDEYEDKIMRLEALNDALAGKVNNLEDQFNNLARSQDIERIHKYASKHELVNENHLMELVMAIYEEDIEKNKDLFVDESYIENIIYKAYNRELNEDLKTISNPENLDILGKSNHDIILNNLKSIAENYAHGLGFIISDYQEQKIHEVLWEYALQLAQDGLDEESIDKDEVIKLVEPILM